MSLVTDTKIKEKFVTQRICKINYVAEVRCVCRKTVPDIDNMRTEAVFLSVTKT